MMVVEDHCLNYLVNGSQYRLHAYDEQPSGKHITVRVAGVNRYFPLESNKALSQSIRAIDGIGYYVNPAYGSLVTSSVAAYSPYVSIWFGASQSSMYDYYTLTVALADRLAGNLSDAFVNISPSIPHDTLISLNVSGTEVGYKYIPARQQNVQTRFVWTTTVQYKEAAIEAWNSISASLYVAAGSHFSTTVSIPKPSFPDPWAGYESWDEVKLSPIKIYSEGNVT